MRDDCYEARMHLEMFLDGECGAVTQRTVVAHLQECGPCMQRADFERHVRTTIAVRCRDVAPAGLLERVIVSLRER